MELWIATANLENIKKAYRYPIKGVLTNPSIICKENRSWKETVKKMDSFGNLPIGLQVVSTQEKGILKEIREYKKLVNNRVLHLKIPFSVDAINLAPFLKRMNYTVNITAVSSFSQAILSLENNIDYLSVYVGRITDNGEDGLETLSKIKEYSVKANKDTKILAASIRNIEYLEKAAIIGADAVAIPLSLLEKAYEHNVTTESIKKFQDDWEKLTGGN